MFKKIISLVLCVLMLVSVFAGCAKEEEDDGAYINMYITDPVYNFDPARAYGNESALKIVSLMFDNLFVLNDNGKVEKSLAKSYKVYEDKRNEEYKMIITLNNACWSDGTTVSANDVVFAWKRILDPSNSFEAAALLYDIKNAREAKEGDKSIDDVRIYAINETQVEVIFNAKIDYDAFLLNLTSYALAPLREDIVNQAENEFDWAKKPAIMVTSGPFRLREVSYEEGAEGLVLERNSYYYRDVEKDPVDEAVTPYRLIVDYSKSAEEIMNAYSNGEIFYVGDIPLSLRGQWKEEADITDALSTHSYVLNENANVRYYTASGFQQLSNSSDYKASTSGDKIFAKPEVRKALSLAIDREAIANAIVFAKAATGLVPEGVFNTDKKKDTFREIGGNLIATSAKIEEAKTLLASVNVDATKYMFAISVPAYDEVHMKIAEMVQEAWGQLGFHVAIQAIDVVNNKDKDKTTDDVISGIKDDIFAERYSRGEFEVAAIDYTAFSVNAFSVLAPFAKGYTGRASVKGDSPDFSIPTHITGYNSAAYNEKIEAASKATDLKEKATILHEAETILMEDMPIIPVIFNQNATLTSKQISKEKFTYYGAPVFTKLKLKNYEQYIPTEE